MVRLAPRERWHAPCPEGLGRARGGRGPPAGPPAPAPRRPGCVRRTGDDPADPDRCRTGQAAEGRLGQAQMKSSWAPSVFSMKSAALMMPSTSS